MFETNFYLTKWLCLWFIVLSILVLVINAQNSFYIDQGRYETEDSIILEVPDSLRAKRDLSTNEAEIHRDGKQFEQILVETGPCYNNRGQLGKCTAFKQCYPYFKLPELSNWETWIFGMYDTCSYYSDSGRQMYGVCCVNPTPVKPTKKPVIIDPISDNLINGSASEKVLIKEPVTVLPLQASWPPTHPPLPTHPPDHTIPPLPTHPPSPGYPVQTQPTPAPQPTWSTQKPITMATRPQWPPSVPTLATPKPTTPRPVNVVPVDASCGAKNGYQDQERIVGGHNADIGEWPWIAALFNGGRQFCGGSLIDNMHILSAAHCVAHMSSWDVARLTVRLGDHNIKTNSEVNHIEKRVKRVVRHRGFDSRTLYNDVAILTLDSPVQFSRQVRPICLPSSGGTFAGKTATVIGWGSLRESGPQPAILQEVNIPIWSNGECRAKYGPAAPGGIVEHMLCAGQASRDSCSGDSGGPLMVNEGRWTQVGIVSWGIGCGKGQYPGVYTRVTHFLPWINKNLK
ncbi:proclotting enzyme-like [Chrysoperla carnea]|uniref:proclotting enzyme-like n=1 Tax=Chrysoperla carnea TaxID=189513 RepID=UPI001D06179B|nr:proclotting enzyme-like [Chrysoperla carnea]